MKPTIVLALLFTLTATPPAHADSDTEPTHCRFTTVMDAVTADNGQVTLRERDVVTEVRKPADIEDFVTGKGNDYQVVDKYCSSSPGGKIENINYWCIEQGDRLTITKTWTGKLRVRHEKFIGPQKVLLVKAKLELEKKHGIWALGTATTPGGTAIGTYVAFVRPKEKECRHTRVKEGQLGLKPKCSSVLVEYFADGDDYAKAHLPVISEAKTNVRPAINEKGVYVCMKPPGPRETSDGEGDYGPDKP
jgi:hypothetical protein